MTLDPLSLQIMSQVTEDLTGLWELAATKNAPPINELIRALDALIANGQVVILSGTQFASEEVELQRARARAAIRNPAYWQWSAPGRGVHLRALASQAGRAWYFAQRQQAPGPSKAS